MNVHLVMNGNVWWLAVRFWTIFRDWWDITHFSTRKVANPWRNVHSLNSRFEILCTCALLYTTKKKHTNTHTHWYIQTHTYTHSLIHTDTDTYRHWYIQTLIYTDTDIYRHSLIHTDTHWYIQTDTWIGKNLILIDALEYTSNDTYRQAYRQIPECGKKSLFDLCFIIYRYLLLSTTWYIGTLSLSKWWKEIIKERIIWKLMYFAKVIKSKWLDLNNVRLTYT